MTGQGFVVLGLVLVVVVGLLLLVRRSAGQGSADPPGLGRRVLVGIGRPRSAAGLARLAAAMARPDKGEVRALTVLPASADDATQDGARAGLDVADAVAREAGTTSAAEVRIDASPADGILHVSVQEDASAIVVGWPSLGGQTLDEPARRVLTDAPCPVLIARFDAERWARVVLHTLEPEHRTGAWDAARHLAAEVLCRVAVEYALPAVRVGPVVLPERWDGAVDVPEVELDDDGGAVGIEGDLTVVPVAPDMGAVMRALRRARPVGDLVLAVPHGTDVHRKRSLSPVAEALVDQTVSEADTDGQGEGGTT